MNYGSDAADQIVRYSLEGTEMALRLSGTAAKNFAAFVAAVLKDQKKTHGKTKLVRMLKDGRPLKFFTVPSDRMHEFAQEAKKRGLLYVPIRDKKNPAEIELVVFADDAAKVNRVMDRMNLDFVGSAAGEAVAEAAEMQHPDTGERQTQNAQVGDEAVPFEIGKSEEDFAFGTDAEAQVTAPAADGKTSAFVWEAIPPAAQSATEEKESSTHPFDDWFASDDKSAAQSATEEKESSTHPFDDWFASDGKPSAQEQPAENFIPSPVDGTSAPENENPSANSSRPPDTSPDFGRDERQGEKRSSVREALKNIQEEMKKTSAEKAEEKAVQPPPPLPKRKKKKRKAR